MLLSLEICGFSSKIQMQNLNPSSAGMRADNSDSFEENCHGHILCPYLLSFSHSMAFERSFGPQIY